MALRVVPAERLKSVLSERSRSDDAATAVFQEGDLIVVLRLRRESRDRILIIDDGRGPVRVGPLHSLKELEQVLPRRSEDDQVGYDYARRLIHRAFSEP